MEIIKQLSIFLENRNGRLADMTGVLSEAGINMTAFSIAESSDFGIMRVVVSEPEKAQRILLGKGFAVSLSDMICVRESGRPGLLSRILELFSAADIAVEYMYAFEAEGQANLMICPDNIEKCASLLQDNRI